MRWRKSGTSTSTVVAGERSRTARIQATKCPAPRSGRSSRSTEVMTTYFKPSVATASARCAGSVSSSGSGLPCATSQNGQRRVHLWPMIMNVAVPLLKHSPIFGQDASSHTVCSALSRRRVFTRWKFGLAGRRTRSQSGLRSVDGAGSTLTGMRDTLSRPRWPSLREVVTGGPARER
jgi:hypothetical protein